MIFFKFLWPFSGNVRDHILKLGSRLDYSDISFASILLALNSALWPYRGIVHDARYYALQALNNSLNGRFAHDLFLEFGSQDNYSIFSHIMGPLVTLLGLDLAFWLAYLASSAILIYAIVRFLRSLIPDRNLANIGIVLVVATPILYGGSGSFRVIEPFFTARLIAEGFGLLGLAAILQKRAYRAIGFALASIAFHPIMGIGSLLAIAGLFLKDKLRTRLAICISGLLLLGALGSLVFIKWGVIAPLIAPDKLWFDLVKHRAFTCFPLHWRFVDWYRMAGSIAIIAGCYRWLEPRARVLCGILALISIAGILSSVLGEYWASPLLVQGQGYRTFWQIQIIAMPLAFWAMIRLSNRFPAFGGWVALSGYILLTNPFFTDNDTKYLALLAFQAGLLLCISGFFLYKKFIPAMGAKQSLLICLVIATIGFSLVAAGGIIRTVTGREIDPISLIHQITVLIRCTFAFLFAFWILYVALSVNQILKRATVIALFIWIPLSLILFLMGQRPSFKERLRPGYKQALFIKRAIEKNLGDSGEAWRDKQIYWPECPELIWFDLKTNSYYSYSQLAGVVFSKNTILEGIRRATLAKPFEIARIKECKPPLGKSEADRLRFLNATLNSPAPTREDLIRLADDKKLDWIILNAGFSGLYSATNGSVYVYDCSRIRQSAQR